MTADTEVTSTPSNIGHKACS